MIRRPRLQEAEAITLALESAIARSPRPDVKRLGNVPIMVRHLLASDHVLVVNDAYLLAYAIGSPWYSDLVMIQEQLVLRIGAGGFFCDVCEALDRVAEVADADAILVGGTLSTNINALARLYQRHGYQRADDMTLIKWRSQWAESLTT